jgi:hypothetical protein
MPLSFELAHEIEALSSFLQMTALRRVLALFSRADHPAWCPLCEV